MLFEQFVVPGALVPAVAALAALGGTILVDRRRRASTVGGGSLALAAAFVAAFGGIGEWPRWPPVDSTQRLFFVVALAGLAGLVWGWTRERRSPWALRGGLLGLLLVLVLRAPLQNSWDLWQAVAWLSGLFALGLAIGWSLDSSLGAGTGWRTAMLRLALLVGTAALLGLSGSVRLAQLLGAVACGAAVVELLAPRSGRRPWLPADSMVLSSAIFGLLLCGYFFAALAPLPAALVAAAWVLLGPATRRQGWWRGLALLPLAVALALAGFTVLTEEEDPYGDYGLAAAEAKGNIEAAGA